MSMAVIRNDPYPDSNFEISIAGISDDGRSVKGSFAEVSGLQAEIEVIEYRTGSDDTAVRKLPGLRKFSNITLKRGIIGDLTFWNWLASAMNGQVVRADGTIVLLDEKRQPVVTWKFHRAWPCRWSGPDLDGKSREVALEMLEICHEGLEMV
jgi:phage tail-like protein